MRWNNLLVDQLDSHWQHQLRERLGGLSDEEYFWEPVSDVWSIRPHGTSTAPIQVGSGEWAMDYAFPEPSPPPVTTIAWRLGHLIVGVLGMRNAAHFDGPPIDYQTFPYAGHADEALAQLDTQYNCWLAGVRSLGDDGLAQPCGAAEGPLAEESMATLVLQITRENHPPWCRDLTTPRSTPETPTGERLGIPADARTLFGIPVAGLDSPRFDPIWWRAAGCQMPFHGELLNRTPG